MGLMEKGAEDSLLCRFDCQKSIPWLVIGTDVSIREFLGQLEPLVAVPLTYIDCGSPLSLNGLENDGTVHRDGRVPWHALLPAEYRLRRIAREAEV